MKSSTVCTNDSPPNHLRTAVTNAKLTHGTHHLSGPSTFQFGATIIAISLSCCIARRNPIKRGLMLICFDARRSTRLIKTTKKAASKSGGKMLWYFPVGCVFTWGKAHTKKVLSVSRPLGATAS